MPTYYVKPSGSNAANGLTPATAWATPEYAATHATTGDTVVFYAGTYRFAAAISATAIAGQTWNTAGDGDVAFSGGQVITGWTLYDAPTNTYFAATALNTRNLFVSNRRCFRSKKRFAGTATATDATTITTSDNYLASAINKTAIELLWHQYAGGFGGVDARWFELRCTVASVVTSTITGTSPGYSYCHAFLVYLAGLSVSRVPYYVENVWEDFFADAITGTFYCDYNGTVSGTPGIYYVPRATEDLSTANVVGAKLEQLIQGTGGNGFSLVGQSGSYFRLSETQNLRPASSDGQAAIQANVSSTNDPYDSGVTGAPNLHPAKATVELSQSSNVLLKRVVFERLGTTAVWVYDASTDWEIAGCVFSDLSGNWLQIGHPNEINPGSPTQRISVHDFVAHNYGQEFRDANGLLLFYAAYVTVDQFSIYEAPYSGMQIGWGWGATGTTTNASQHNAVTHGVIVNVGWEFDDTAGIYVNGAQSSTTIQGNVITNVNTPSAGGGIYMDDGTTGTTVNANLVYACRNWFWDRSEPGNSFTSNIVDTANGTEVYPGNSTFTGTTVTADPLTDGAAIIAAAGVTGTYADTAAIGGQMVSNGRRLHHPTDNPTADVSASLSPLTGTIAFRLTPEFEGNDGAAHAVFEAAVSGGWTNFVKFTDNNLYAGNNGFSGDVRVVIPADGHFIPGHESSWVLTYDTTVGTKLYRDGVKIGETLGAFTIPFSPGASDLTLGNFSSAHGLGAAPFAPDFGIRYFAIYNTVLSGTDITALGTSTPDTVGSGLVAYWPMQETYERALVDTVAGKNFDLTTTAAVSLLQSPDAPAAPDTTPPKFRRRPGSSRTGTRTPIYG